MPGALTWDPTPPGGSQSTARGGVNPSADGASFSPAEVAGLKGVVSADGISDALVAAYDAGMFALPAGTRWASDQVISAGLRSLLRVPRLPR